MWQINLALVVGIVMGALSTHAIISKEVRDLQAELNNRKAIVEYQIREVEKIVPVIETVYKDRIK